MKKFAFIFLLLTFSACSKGTDNLPNSIKLLNKEYSLYESLVNKATQNYSQESEKTFKNELVSSYKNIYDGELLNNISKWVMEGSLESSYYSDLFYGLDKMKVLSANKLDDHRYKVVYSKEVCESPYGMMAPSSYETFLNDHKITNISQKDFNHWLGMASDDEEYCLTSKIEKIFALNDKKLIILETTTIIKSDIELTEIKKKEKKAPEHFGVTLGEIFVAKNASIIFSRKVDTSMYSAYSRTYGIDHPKVLCSKTTLYAEGDLMCIEMNDKKIVHTMIFIKSYGKIDITNPTKNLNSDYNKKLAEMEKSHGEFECHSLNISEIKSNINSPQNTTYRTGIFIVKKCISISKPSTSLFLDLDHSGNGGDIVTIYTI